MSITLRELAAGRGRSSRGAAWLIEAGFAPSTRVDDLTAGSVTRTLAETFARELARLHDQLDETYENAFLETGVAESLEQLVDGLGPCRPWWRSLLRRLLGSR